MLDITMDESIMLCCVDTQIYLKNDDLPWGPQTSCWGWKMQGVYGQDYKKVDYKGSGSHG